MLFNRIATVDGNRHTPPMEVESSLKCNLLVCDMLVTQPMVYDTPTPCLEQSSEVGSTFHVHFLPCQVGNKSKFKFSLGKWREAKFQDKICVSHV